MWEPRRTPWPAPFQKREVELGPDIMPPLVVYLGESIGIRSLELRILEREEGPQPVGLSGIEIQERL